MPLPSSYEGVHMQTKRLMVGFVKYAVEMGSCAMILHTKFKEGWFKHSKVYRGIHIQHGDFITLL
jgi:hypothetical protein